MASYFFKLNSYMILFGSQLLLYTLNSDCNWQAKSLTIAVVNNNEWKKWRRKMCNDRSDIRDHGKKIWNNFFFFSIAALGTLRMGFFGNWELLKIIIISIMVSCRNPKQFEMIHNFFFIKEKKKEKMSMSKEPKPSTFKETYAN